MSMRTTTGAAMRAGTGGRGGIDEIPVDEEASDPCRRGCNNGCDESRRWWRQQQVSSGYLGTKNGDDGTTAAQIRQIPHDVRWKEKENSRR
jgi:hypothetical protein